MHNIPLIATIANTSETASFNFVIRTGGLAITNGYPIISTNGSTSAVITITDSPIEKNDTITIDVSGLTWYVVDSGAFTNDNVLIHDTAVAATWTALVDPDALTLTLTSTSGTTNPGDKITVTFTGEENPWIVNTGGPQNYLLPVTRNDQLGEGAINFTIETGLSGGLEITNGNPITTTNGTTSAVITITDSPIEVNDTITINIRDLHDYVANGTFTTDNVVISDSATAAVWTGVVDGDTLFLTSTEGPTYPGSQVTITFTGAAGHPWVDDSGGEYTIGLKATRTDGFGVGYFSFVIHTVPPVDVNLVADFSASPTRAFAPATIAFTDLSTGNPTSWNWMFGDDGTSTEQNPTHLYKQPGSYDVTLTVSDSIGISMVSKTNYIYLNETIREANTSIAGLSIANCGGPQTVTVDTSILTPVLRSGTSELEIQPPPGSGFKNIIFYGDFSLSNNLITGNPTSVHLISEDITPEMGFSGDIGTGASFSYSMDLPYYPCNAQLITKISEGITPYYDTKFRQIASANNASPVGTAYTATITKTNFPSGTPAKIFMSVNSSWRSSHYGDYIFIWRIADDETYGQFLPTHYLYSDPVKNLDYYESDSPLGLSTIGLSATTGNNNPFQMIAFIAPNIVNSGRNTQSRSESSSYSQITTDVGQGDPNLISESPVQEPEQEKLAIPQPLTQPAVTTFIGMIIWVITLVRENPLIMLMIIPLMVLLVCADWWRRRL